MSLPTSCKRKRGTEMRRDMMKIIGNDCMNVHIPAAYDMRSAEWKMLYDMAIPKVFQGVTPPSCVLDAIRAAFAYGFVLGSRAERNGAIKKRL